MIRNQDLAQEIGKKRGKARVDVEEMAHEAGKKVDVGEIDQNLHHAGIEPRTSRLIVGYGNH